MHYVYQNHEADEMKIESDPSISNTQHSLCSYEDWIRECHPENTELRSHGDDENKKNKYNGIDSRFYLKHSDHRIIWNGYCHAYGLPELKICCDYRDSIRNEGKVEN